MALNLATLRTRSLTAAIFVVVMLAGLLWNHWSFFILFTIIHFGCWAEYQRLITRIDPSYGDISTFHKYGVRIAGWCVMLYATSNAYNIAGLQLHALGWWIGLVLVLVFPVFELLVSGNIRVRNVGYSSLGLLYISGSWGAMIALRNHGLQPDMGTDTGYALPCFLIFSIWLNDTMAYIVGSLIGRTPFSSISPKKTWEGTAGGALLAVLIMGFWGSTLLAVSRTDAFVIAGIAAVAGTLGDLLESKLKRMADVKDSGSFMPGHGGFLDRFDSLLLATPLAWAYIAYFG